MFSDFDKNAQSKEGRGRMGVSLLVAALLFLGIAAALATAVATARAVVARRERDVPVEFAALPAPEPEPVVELPPPPPPPPRAARPRRGPRQPDLGPPSEIPHEQPSEAEGELTDPGDLGPIDNDGGGDGDGDGGDAPAPTQPAPPAPPPGPPEPPRPEPEQVRETVTPPRFVSGCRAPEIPEALHDQAATIRIEVRLSIGTDGSVLNATIVTGSPLVPDEWVLRCVRDQRYEPAALPDGTRVPFPLRRRFVFRPDSL